MKTKNRYLRKELHRKSYSVWCIIKCSVWFRWLAFCFVLLLIWPWIERLISKTTWESRKRRCQVLRNNKEVDFERIKERDLGNFGPWLWSPFIHGVRNLSTRKANVFITFCLPSHVRLSTWLTVYQGMDREGCSQSDYGICDKTLTV